MNYEGVTKELLFGLEDDFQTRKAQELEKYDQSPSDFYTYKGQWKNDLKHGQGKIVFFDEVQFEGTWENGKIKDGQMVWNQTGEIFDGFYSVKSGRFFGKGKLI